MFRVATYAWLKSVGRNFHHKDRYLTKLSTINEKIDRSRFYVYVDELETRKQKVETCIGYSKISSLEKEGDTKKSQITKEEKATEKVKNKNKKTELKLEKVSVNLLKIEESPKSKEM